MRFLRSSRPARLRRFRRLTGAAVLGSLVAATSLAAAAPQAEALTCKSNQKVRVSASVREYRYAEQYSGGGMPRRTGEKNYYWDGGHTDLVVTTCLSNGVWVPMSPFNETPYFNGLTRNGTTIGLASGYVRGFATMAQKLTRGTLTVGTTVCHRPELFTGLKEVLGLPLPAKVYVAVGAWLGSKLVPDDRTDCNLVYSVGVPVTYPSGWFTPRVTTGSGAIYRSSSIQGDIKLVNEWWITYTIKRV